MEVAKVAADKCASKNYELSVSVERGHLLLTDEPKCDGSTRGTKYQECPSLAFHTMKKYIEGQTHMEKYVHRCERTESDESLALGVFALGGIVQAYQDASLGSGTEYNFINNDCASVTIDMGRKLGINPMNHKIIKFVSRKLKEDSRSHCMLTDLADQGEGAIENFVLTCIEERVQDCSPHKIAVSCGTKMSGHPHLVVPGDLTRIRPAHQIRV